MKYLSLIIIFILLTVTAFAQDAQQKDISKMNREEVLQMSMEEMSDLGIEDLMKLVEIAGVSSIEELYAILNKDVTSASKSAESLFDSPLSTTVLSQEEIMASGATSIEEALRLVPGIIVREKTNGNYDVQIRGNQNMPMGNMLLYSENTTTLVMVDGRPVFNYGMGGILWETLPVSLGELDRIEVVRGPSSALYGPNAVDGVINLITKNPDGMHSAVNIQSGTQNTHIGDISLSNKVSEKVSLGFSGYYEYRERITDDIYAFPYADSGFVGDFYSLEDYAYYNDIYKLSNDSAYGLFVNNNPGRAKQKVGANTYLQYSPSADMNFRLAAGYMTSEANSSPLGDNATSHNVRQSEGGYLNFMANVYGVNLNASLSNVIQNFHRGHNGWKEATEQYNVSLDYLMRFGGLQIRPGISYQSVYYDDRDYVEEVNTGFFNDRYALRNYAASVRFDYSLMEKIRLVAALRGEKYNVPDRIIPSWQFVGSYKLNDNNLIRAVYSRANQSTFMINAFSNYTWDRSELQQVPEFIHFAGNSDPDMMTMDMIEIGYRTRPSKGIFIDVEAFYNTASGFSALMPDSMAAITYVANPILGLRELPASLTLYTSHRGQGVKSTQMGLSAAADVVLNSKLLLKAHATFQKTTLDNSLGFSRNDVAAYQFLNSIGNPDDPYNSPEGTFLYDIYHQLEGTVPKEDYSSSDQIPEMLYEDDVDNKAIPSFWGSMALIYRPLDKLEIMTQGYYYNNYTFNTQYGEKDMGSKFLLNAKVTYKVTDGLSLFLNGRNILGSETIEYPYMDEIGGIYLLGLNFKL